MHEVPCTRGEVLVGSGQKVLLQQAFEQRREETDRTVTQNRAKTHNNMSGATQQHGGNDESNGAADTIGWGEWCMG